MTKFVGNTITLPKLATAPSSPVDGDMYYNTTSGILYGYIGGVWTDLAATGGGGGGGSTIAESVRAAVRNVSGATIAKGSIVMLNGVNGQKPTITKAIATGDATSAATFGWVEGDITNNSDGYVTTFGILNNLDTSAFSDGQYLYLSGTTAGAATSTKTYAPTHNVTVGFVIKGGSAGAGQVFVYIKNGFELDEIHDVATHAYPPTNGQVLTFDATSSLWKPSTRVVSVSGTGAISSTGGDNPTISVASASTSTAGVVQLTDSTSSTSTTTAATPYSVKAAYDLASAAVPKTTTLTGTAPITVGGVSGTGQDLSANRTIAVTAASTSASGVVQLSDSTSTTSSTYAATSTAAKAAYDRGTEGVTAASAAQSTANAAVPKTTTLTGTAPITVGGVSGTGVDLSDNRTIAVTSADTTNAGVVILSDAIDQNVSNKAATSKAAKTAYDLASTANSTAGAAIPKSTVTTAGDLIVASGNAQVTRLGLGSSNQYLKVSSGAATWSAISASDLPALNSITAPTGNVSLANYKIVSLGTPIYADDAATKGYVDNVTAGINTHAPVVAASTSNISGTYANGTADQSGGLGIGATFTATANGAISLDGVSPTSGQRVLLKDQTDQKQNGIYTVTTVGTGSTPFVLTRATDSNNSIADQVRSGDFVYISSDPLTTSNGGQSWVMNSVGTGTGGTIKFGTDGLNWVQFSGVSSVTAGSGLARSGNTINVGSVNGGGITVNADSIQVDTGVVATLTDSQNLLNKTYNKVTITAPASSATLTLANGSTLLTSGAYSLTLTSQATTNVTFPSGTKTLLATDGDGSSLTSLNAGALSGTIPNAVLGKARVAYTAIGSRPSTPNVGDIWVDQNDTTGLINVVNGNIANNKGEVLVATADNVVGVQTVAAANNYVLTSDSSTSTGVKWALPSAVAIIDAQGDLIVGSGPDALARLGIGTAGQVLRVNAAGTSPFWDDEIFHPFTMA